jgi:riboflavin kinase/FMN adenylyltransferase
MRQAAEGKGLEPVVFTFKNRTTCNITTDSGKHSLLKKLGVKRVFSYDFMEIKDMSPKRFVSEILIGELGAGSVSCGFDFRFGASGKGDTGELTRLCGGHGIEAVIVPAVEVGGVAVSSSNIRGLIALGNIEKANRLLGYELSYRLKVVGGNKLGRTIGFPTINQNIPRSLVLPRFGVYRSSVCINKIAHPSITNVGVKPTAGNNINAAAETHIIGYDGDLYGKTLKLSLTGFVRDERKFNNFAELTEQIKEDLKVITNG